MITKIADYLDINTLNSNTMSNTLYTKRICKEQIAHMDPNYLIISQFNTHTDELNMVQCRQTIIDDSLINTPSQLIALTGYDLTGMLCA